METYLQMKERHREELESFPMMFAFSKEQFAEGMKKLGLEPTDTKKICSVGGGGFIRKTDGDALGDLFEKFHAEEAEARKSDEYLLQMFSYELNNHEYCYTWDVVPTLSSLGLTLEQVKANAQMNKALCLALDEVRKEVA